MNSADLHLAVPGARLRYRDAGAGPAVVFIHGWTFDLDIWEPQAALAAHLRVVRFDRRGFGLSEGTASLEDDVSDLRALIAALGLTSPLLVGMSQGARVALDFTARHPELVRALLLDGAPPCAQSDLPMELFRETARRAGIEAFRKLWAEHPMTQLVTLDPAMHVLRARVLGRYHGNDLLAPASAARDSIDAATLARIRVPVRIVNGEDDLESRRRAGQELRAALPTAGLVTVPHAGHLPNLDAPREYNHIVNEFARRQLPAVA